MAEGDLTSQVEGDIGLDGKVLVIRRIRVTYHLKLGDEHRELAQRVHGFHAEYCPVARTIQDCVEIQTELRFQS
ncbi:MAG: OsmC family protein [Deltaproteobacteria bacterium]|nr:OsmC family protein [Deltaproteobacteria bacterium]